MEYPLKFSDLKARRGLCCYQLDGKQHNGLLCGQRINQGDGAKSDKIIGDIECGRLKDECLDDTLMTLLNLKCCNHYHREKKQDIGLKKRICQQWKDQILARDCDATNGVAESRVCSQTSSTVPVITTTSNSNGPVTRARANGDSSPRETLAQTYNAEGVVIRAGSVFIPYKRKLTMWTLLTALLTPKCLTPGIVYLFTALGYTKIGATGHSVSDRIKATRNKCGKSTKAGYQTDMVPNAFHVERLAHLELEIKGCRLREICPCGVTHREWFHVDEQEAESTIRVWADWIRRARPYNAAGQLSPMWSEIILQMEEAGIPITGQVLVDRIPSTDAPATVENVQERGLEEDLNAPEEGLEDDLTLLESSIHDAVPKAVETSTADDSSTLLDANDMSDGERASGKAAECAIVVGPELLTTTPEAARVLLAVALALSRSTQMLERIQRQQREVHAQIIASVRQHMSAPSQNQMLAPTSLTSTPLPLLPTSRVGTVAA